MKKGFTLAEVLITLAVIGVVAAITIPIVVSNYQKKALYTQFMKTYNQLSSAMDLASVDNEGSWDLGSGSANNKSAAFLNAFKPYLKTASMPSCTGVGAPLSLSGEDWKGYDDYCDFIGDDDTAVALQDGAIIGIPDADLTRGGEIGVTFTIDINGPKGPNVLGRDIHELIYEGGTLMPDHEYMTDDGDSSSSSSGYSSANCDPSVHDSDQGQGCADRLLQEGKMNY